jgi:hypothetical protein
MTVVGLVAVRQDAIGERRFDRTYDNIGGHDSRHLLTAVTARKRDGQLAGTQGRARNHGAQRIQNMQLGLFERWRRQRRGCRRSHISAQPFHHRPDRLIRAGGAPWYE